MDDQTPLGSEKRLLRLLTEQDTWIRRRVDRADVEEDGETTRRISFDLALPQHLRVDLDGGVVLPLMLLTKAPLRRLSTTGPDGRSMPVLGRQDNGSLVTAMLAEALRVLYSGGLSSDAEAAIASAVFEDDPDEMDNRIQEVRSALPPTQPDVVDQVEVVLALLDDLVRQFLFIVLLPASYVDQRVVVKIAVGEEVTDGPIDWAFSAAGRSLDFSIQLQGSAASAHFEFRAPPGLRVASVTLLDDMLNPLPCPGPAIEAGHTAHLTGLERVQGAGGGVRARVELEPVPEGFIRQTAWATSLVLLLLFVGAIGVDRLEAALENNRGGSMAAAALAVPALFLSLESRRPEHAAVARALFVPRLLNVVSALVLYALAVYLVTARLGTDLASAMWTGFGIQAAVTLVAWTLERNLSDH